MTDENPQRSAARVQHIDRGALDELRTALEREGSGLSLQAIDVIDYVEHLTSARAGLRDALRKAIERADGILAKDFLALYQAARGVTSALQTSAPSSDVELLSLQVRRLAPLFDDVRTSLNALLARRAWPVSADPVEDILRGADAARYPVDPAHSVRVLQLDGSVRVECDHSFHGTARCVHCGKPIADLIAASRAELDRLYLGRLAAFPPETVDEAARRHGLGLGAEGEVTLLQVPSLLPDGVLHATTDELADVISRQLAEHEGRGIINRDAVDRMLGNARIEGAGTDDVRVTFTAPPHEAFDDAPPDEVAVPVVLGPSLRPRIEALVATNRLGHALEPVVQTLFVLGMLAAEGQDPQAHVGDPMLHVSAEALFVRFGLPHEGGADRIRQRANILRQLFRDLAEWCDEGDPVRPAFLAGLEALPRV